MENKPTDKEIKKALEICGKGIMFSKHDCKKCPYYTELNCETKCKQNALDYINRLEAENERLGKELDELAYKLGSLLCHATGGKLSKSNYPIEIMESYVNDTIQDYCEEAEAEAYKECLEKVKALFPSDNEPYQYWEIHEGADSILKEMEGE